MTPGKASNNRYCGVRLCPRLIGDKWHSYYGKSSLGSYDTAAEAAMAHNHAALLLGTTTPPNPVPPEQLPSPERQAVIRREVEKRLGRNGLMDTPNGGAGSSISRAQKSRSPSSTSGYVGVFGGRRSNNWQSNFIWDGRRLWLRAYDTKHEAAFAYNCAIQLLGDRQTAPNVISSEDLPSPERCGQIKALVQKCLQRYGMLSATDLAERSTSLPKISAKSGYRGVAEKDGGTQWSPFVLHSDRRRYLGTYQCRHEAAFAFNHAIVVLMAHHIPPNVVEDAHLPTPERQVSIKLTVEKKLWHLGIIQKEDAPSLMEANLRERYRGVSWHKGSGLWQVRMSHSTPPIELGYYKTEHEGAHAFNLAAQILGLPVILLNFIPDDHVPNPAIQQRTRAKIDAKLAKLRLAPMPLSGHEPVLPEENAADGQAAASRD